jgi:hypothetical protein
MKEAVAQASHSYVASPPPALQLLGNVVENAESIVELASKFSDAINDICGKLEFLQELGDKLSEVGYYAVVRSAFVESILGPSVCQIRLVRSNCHTKGKLSFWSPICLILFTRSFKNKLNLTMP